MGMFDSVLGQCPKCRENIEFQSKAGECSLLEYHIENVPIQIAADLLNDIIECKCGELLKIISPNLTTRVFCQVVIVNPTSEREYD